MKKMADKEAQHIDLIKCLWDELQEQVIKANCLSEELKQENQQLLKVDKQTSLLQANYDIAILENLEEKKKVTSLTTELESLKNDLPQYQASEEERWEERKKKFLK